MKNSILILFIFASLSAFSQDSEYKVSSYLTEGTKAPNIPLSPTQSLKIDTDEISIYLNLKNLCYKYAL